VSAERIVVVGIGYVGLSLAVLLSQRHEVVAVDIDPERVAAVNRRESPLVDSEISHFFASKDLQLSASLDADEAFRDATVVIVATPTNYDSDTNSFDTATVESTIARAHSVNPNALIVVK